MTTDTALKLIHDVKAEVTSHIVGQDKLVDDTIICLFAGGNLLLEGLPGLGKTKLVSVLARTLGLDFKRIQFTPDLMPADITGTNIFNRETNNFEFQKGPVFTNILLADEINRATPKTQAAMLEAMQEKSVSIAGHTYPLNAPYMVLATQNPIEQEGTYPLPEAQLDRFMFKLNVEFPDAASLARIVSLTTGKEEAQVKVIADPKSVLAAIDFATTVPAATSVIDYAMRLIVATHPKSEHATDMVDKYVIAGASPRGAQNIIKSARVKALMQGRFNVSFEDIDAVAIPVLRHRLALGFNALQDGIDVEHIIQDILDRTSR